jgi:hypothetical protein
MQPNEVFLSLETLNNIDREKLNVTQISDLDSEIIYLTFLEQIKNFNFEDRQELNQLELRNDLIKQISPYLDTKENKEVILKIAV